MASTDARPVPRKNTAYRVTFPIVLSTTGATVTGATGLDSEVSIDGGTFADCIAEATEIATASGIYYLDLAAAEMNGDTIAIVIKTTTVDAQPTVIVLYPEEIGDYRVNVSQWNGTTVATPATAGIPDVNVKNAANVAWASGAITAASIAADAIASTTLAASVGTEIATAVWASGTRLLTAGTNIALAKGVGVTGFTDLSAADVRTAVGLATNNLDTQLSGLDTQFLSAAELRSAIGLATNNLDTQITALGAQLTAIDDFVDTEVAAIKGQTDKFTFGVSGQVNANVTYINEIEVTGDGTSGTAWGPA